MNLLRAAALVLCAFIDCSGLALASTLGAVRGELAVSSSVGSNTSSGYARPSSKSQSTLQILTFDVSSFGYWSAPYFHHGYHNFGPYSSVDAAIAGWWADYQSVWPSAFPGCSYNLTEYDPNTGSVPGYPGVVAIMLLGGTCGGGNWITATQYTFDTAKNTGDGAGCDGGEGDDKGGSGSGTGGDAGSRAPTCQERDGSPLDSSSQGAPMAGDPINTSTGNKFLQDDDYIGNPWLTFRRFYNSSAAVAASTIGAHWRHSFDRSLTVLAGAANGPVITMFRPDGKRDVFLKTNGQWRSDPSVSDLMVENDNAQGTAASYTVFIAARRHFETYDTTGLLQSVTDETGTGIALAYSNTLTAPAIAPKPGLLLTVTDPTGRQLTFTYDSSARVHQVTLPDGGTLAYAYDTAGNLISVQYPDSKTRQYVYNESTLTGGANLPNAMTGIVDEAGVRYENTTFDSTGRATSSSFAGNVGNTHITYNADGTSTVQYPLGISSKMTFSTIQGLVKVASADQACSPQCGQPWKTRLYDTNGYPSSYTDFNGHVTTKIFDSTGLLTQNVDASGTMDQRTTNITWDTTLRNPLTQATEDAQGKVVLKEAWVYNALGEAVARCEMDPAIPAAASYTCAATGTAPQGVRRWTYSYCTTVDTTSCPIAGLLLSVDGPRTDALDVTTYSYYMTDSATSRHGDLKTVTDALGHVTSYLSYDGAGRVLVVQDANGVFTNFAYTPRGWLASRTIRTTSDNSPSSTDSATLITYKDFGSVASVTDPDGVVTSLTYDGAHRLTDVADNLGAHVRYTLDAAGNKIKEETFDASSTVIRSLSRNFNTLGQLTAVVDGFSHTVLNAGLSDSYDANGNLVHTTDGLGIERKRSYDALDRLVSTLDNYNGTDATTRNAQSVSTFDALGRVIGMSDPAVLAPPTLSMRSAIPTRCIAQTVAPPPMFMMLRGIVLRRPTPGASSER